MHSARAAAFVILGLLASLGGSGLLGCASAPVSRDATDEDEEVRCEWRCGCAAPNDDCDEAESRWELCVDDDFRPRDDAPDCAACRRLARADCAERSCPPAPPRVTKFPFEVLCDGVPQDLETSGPVGFDPAMATASVALPLAEDVQSLLDQIVATERAQAAQRAVSVTCSFLCMCRVVTGICDSEEGRSRLCADKEESTETASSCDLCRVLARARCFGETCPLAVPRMRKVVGSFRCPA